MAAQPYQAWRWPDSDRLPPCLRVSWRDPPRFLAGRALRAQVVMLPGAGHYPQSQRPDVTADAVLRFLESVKGRA